MIFRANTEEERASLIQYLMLRISASKENLVGNMPFDVYGVIRDGNAVGAILLTNYRGTSAEVCLAGEPGWISAKDLRTAMRHLFVERGILRVWGSIARSNGPSRELAKRLGCREIGVLEDEYGPGQDAVLYSMAAKKCKWLRSS